MITTIIFWLVLAFVVAYIGDSRRIGFGGALFWSLLLSPIVGFAITMASERKGTFEEELERVQGKPKGPPPPPMSPQSGDVVERLGKLKEMLESGAITQDEYNAAKKKILE